MKYLQETDMKIYNIEQHDMQGNANPEWLALRAGKFTGSDFSVYMGMAKTGKLSETAKKELSKKVLENFGYRFDIFQTPAMTRGIELEPTAREAYSFIYGKDIKEVGFVDLETYHAGCSPDGVIYDEDGNIKEIIEIKCPMIETFVSYLDDEFMNSDYAVQVQFNMFITGADVCHFIVYHPDFNLIVRDIPKDEDMQAKIQTVLENLQDIYDKMYKKVAERRLDNGNNG